MRQSGAVDVPPTGAHYKSCSCKLLTQRGVASGSTVACHCLAAMAMSTVTHLDLSDVDTEETFVYVSTSF